MTQFQSTILVIVILLKTAKPGRTRNYFDFCLAHKETFQDCICIILDQII